MGKPRKFEILKNLKLVSQLKITAVVGIISPKDNPNLYIAVKNKRGWDIPGGHIEKNEDPFKTMFRELREEAGCTLLFPLTLIAALKGDGNTAMLVYRGFCKIDNFHPTNEVKERAIFSKEELVKNYFGNKTLLKSLLTIAQT